MRIAIFAEFFLPKIDGVVTHTSNCIKCLQNLGDEVLVFCANPGIEEHYGARVCGLPSISFPFYHEWKMAIPIPKIERELKSFKPDVVFVIEPIFMGTIAIYYTNLLKLPLVIAHCTDWGKYLVSVGLPFLKELAWKFLLDIRNRGDLTIAPSDFTINQLKKRGFKSVDLWPMGIDVSRFNPNKKSDEMRIYLSNGHVDNPLIIFVGRLSPEKNVLFIKRIIEALPETHLAIIGDGPERPNLEKNFAGNRVKFTGYFQGEKLSAAYASADVFLFPSEFETLGNVVLEAMVSGCPVVGCRAGGLQSIITDNKTGLFFEPGDVQGAIEATKQILYNQEKRIQIIMNARNYVKQFSWETSTKKLRQHYQTAIINNLNRQTNPIVPQGKRKNQ